MSGRKVRSPGFWPGFFILLMILFSVVLVRRFTGGLGAVSNLSDEMPWGLWIGFDLLSGVALAAGGFTITAIVYLLHLDRYRPIVRPALLTAFLGYLMVIAALLVDLGRPWNIWHPLIFWNPHSVMFEVGWCVMLYTTVLFLEFLPLVFERFRIQRALTLWSRYLTPPLVIAGVLLSTLHQSSLGTLYVIVPGKLHPLWYSPILPLLFFVSAISLGLAMTSVESFLSLRAFGKRLEPGILRGLGRATAVTLLLYLTLRFEDLFVRGVLDQAFRFDTASIFFLLEVGPGGMLPMLLLFSSRVRRRPLALLGAQLLVVLGLIFQRMNVAITAFQLGTGVSYVPHWQEFVISLGLVAVGFALFALAVRFLPVFPEGPLARPRPTDPLSTLAP
ncbi:MAG: Ni/Fe-hydrogenase cytochrome b subunit [Acidobacteriota bacterium]|nr:Ni/Fe-hydrogenase cytochrome b subunit [Acidobacteriota bacterium]